MATVSVDVNGKSYAIGCEDGQEGHVAALARDFDRQVRDVAGQVGQVGELRLFLMASLLTADEAADARQRLLAVEASSARAASGQTRVDARAVAALDAARARVEALSARMAI